MYEYVKFHTLVTLGVRAAPSDRFEASDTRTSIERYMHF